MMVGMILIIKCQLINIIRMIKFSTIINDKVFIIIFPNN